MASGIRVEIRGLAKLQKGLGASAGQMSGAVRRGLRAGATIVEADAKRRVHSPDNPYIGKAGRSVATGRLQASIGQSDVTGSGIDLSVAVGPPYGLRGSTFSRSSKATGRTGGRRNRSDPQEYGQYEEFGTRHNKAHPFLVPALMENRQDVEDAVRKGVARALEELL